jgi:hypothetical protein
MTMIYAITVTGCEEGTKMIGGILFTLGVTVFCSGVYKVGHFNGYWKREKELCPEAWPQEDDK